MSTTETAQKRTLTLKDLVFSGLCIMAPLAPFTAYYQIADASFGMVGLVYLIGIIAMMFIGFSFAQLSKEFPVAGSAYSYVQRSVNPHIGFITGWANLCLYLFIPGFIYVVAASWLNEIVPSIPTLVWLGVFTLFNLFVNIRGVEVAAKLNNLIFSLQILLIVTFLVLAGKAVFIDGQGLGGFSLLPIFNAEHFDITFIGVAISLAIFGFIGFDTIGALADEAKNPKRDIGKAAIICIISAGLLFFMQTYMAGLVAPDYASLNPETALFDVARMVGGEPLFMALLLINIFVYGITIPINIQSAIARIIYTMSKDDLLPASKFFTKVHPKYNTPINSVLTVGILGFIFAATLNFDLLMGSVNICAVVMYVILNYAVISYFFVKKKQRDLKGIIIYLIIPLIGIGISLFLLTQFTPVALLIASAILLVGVIIGAVKSKGYKKVITIQDI